MLLVVSAAAHCTVCGWCVCYRREFPIFVYIVLRATHCQLLTVLPLSLPFFLFCASFFSQLVNYNMMFISSSHTAGFCAQIIFVVGVLSTCTTYSRIAGTRHNASSPPSSLCINFSVFFLLLLSFVYIFNYFFSRLRLLHNITKHMRHALAHKFRQNK